MKNENEKKRLFQSDISNNYKVDLLTLFKLKLFNNCELLRGVICHRLRGCRTFSYELFKKIRQKQNIEDFTTA